ncbi:hypothetical protein GOP47_0021120 [Adiantum capillus-veneris]|uniref:BZIP domain-containing protein n=1 Tax=Adiantum capillus-veneris TaxID=13818 RepID=A0A9D4Z857_ADICA|nr:hypothetical protein GOP47_0021120 [Adiantum capillus-veneris]
MLVKEEADMETDEREGAIEQRVCKRKKRAVREPDFVYQRRGGRESRSLKKKGRNTQELLWDSRLVKIELDAAQALADFSRLAHLPVRHCPSDLKWSVRRKRTPRSVLKLESQAISKTCGPPCELRTSELESATSLSHGDKTSPNFDCRAESPSSPLPSSKLACRAFLVNGGFTSNLAIRKNVSAEVMRKCIKTEMKDLEPIASSAAKHKSRILKAHVPLCLVKVDPLGEQAISKGEGLQHPKVQPSANLASQLVELRHEMDLAIVDKDKSKTTMTDEDKEARRLRRIQANRESARQTIRKKQLLCEELRRQAASLESENDAMKQKRDMLMQELAFLRGQNYHLKLQLDLRASNHLGSQESLPQLSSLTPWQAPSVPCSYTSFPSHVFGWPKMMTHEGNDSIVKKENTGDAFQKLGSMQCTDAFGTVPGIPASSLGISSFKDLPSNLPVSVFEDGRNSSRVLGTETEPPCELDSRTIDSLQTSGNESKPELESAMQARGSISLDNSQGDCDLEENHSTSRAPQIIDCQMGLKLPLRVTCGSSCTASVGGIPMSGQGFVCSYPWRVTHVTPTAAAEARKRRKELTRKKRLGAKASKLLV